MDFDAWIEKVDSPSRQVHYAHFDRRKSMKAMLPYVQNPEYIRKHAFFPLIHFTDIRRRYRKEAKKREIFYSAHCDRRIYQYYAYLLNQDYNRYVQQKKIHNCVIAYRDNLTGKSNINFAKTAFDFIKSKGECFVIVGDFHHFFESLDHRYLKERMKDVLGVQTLSDDWYHIYKSIIQYSYVELDWLLQQNGFSHSPAGIRKLNKLETVLSMEKLHKCKDNIKLPEAKVGIPQGTAISAVLANVYMICADIALQRFASGHQGIYMRYSDDFIIILPDEEDTFKDHVAAIFDIIAQVPNLELQLEKTQLFHYVDQKVVSCNTLHAESVPNGHNYLDYLGFTFDGQKVKLRAKTTSKYYYRMRHKARTVYRRRKKHKQTGTKELYRLYSSFGEHTGRGNFLTYLGRAEAVFKDENISDIRKRHMYKIKRVLKGK